MPRAVKVVPSAMQRRAKAGSSVRIPAGLPAARMRQWLQRRFPSLQAARQRGDCARPEWHLCGARCRPCRVPGRAPVAPGRWPACHGVGGLTPGAQRAHRRQHHWCVANRTDARRPKPKTSTACAARAGSSGPVTRHGSAEIMRYCTTHHQTSALPHDSLLF